MHEPVRKSAKRLVLTIEHYDCDTLPSKICIELSILREEDN